MPIYEYICEPCGHRFEQLVAGMNLKKSPPCPAGQGKTRRQIV